MLAAAACWIAATVLALGVSPHWRINPDSALYAGLARSIASGQGYTFSGELQASIPPVMPLFLAGVLKLQRLASPDAPFASAFLYFNAATAAAGMIALIGAFLLTLELAGPHRALAVLLFLSLSYRFFDYCIEPLTDIPYCALSWWALVFVVRFAKNGGAVRAFAAAALLALSVLTRVVGVTLAAAVAVFFTVRLLRSGESRKRSIAGLASVLPAVAAAAFLAWMMLTARGSTFNYVDDVTARRGWTELAGGFFSHAREIPSNLFETVVCLESACGLSLVLAAIVIVGAVSLGRRTVLLSAYALAYLALVASSYKVTPRYFVPLLPIFYVSVFEGFSALGALLFRRLSPLSASRAALLARIVAVCVLATNAFYIAREISRNFSRDFYVSYKGGFYKDYLALADSIVADPPPGRIMARHSRIVFTLSGHETTWLPFHPDRPERPGAADVSDYAQERDVGALVIDPEDMEDAEVFRRFLDSRPEWTQRREFGRLTLAARADDVRPQ